MQAATVGEAQDPGKGLAGANPTNVRVEREILYTRILLYFALVMSIFACVGLCRIVLFRFSVSKPALALADAFFGANIIFLLYGSLFYELTRLAYFKRLRNHQPISHDELERIYETPQPHSLAILIPSYREEVRVVRQTLMSAALTEYPDRRVVLLIDDPPDSSNPEDLRRLTATRDLVRDIDHLMLTEKRRYVSELARFERRRIRGSIRMRNEARRLAHLYHQVSAWFEAQAASDHIENHYDQIFVERILLEPARAHLGRALEFEEVAHNSGTVTLTRIRREYSRLAALFNAPISSFERKRFVNLSHASNKAMNLNSYLGLIGRRFRELIKPEGLFLEESNEGTTFDVPKSDYIITLDADSLLLNDYALRLTHIMDQPEAAKFAVVETPYTAVPGSASVLERVAGAQTDVAWINSQGATVYHASFWVGANALLRRDALEDICEVVIERGYRVRRYIQDRTLVEDTESSIDLVARGWKIYCYPERLSYSATPPDFGALIIQRRRWANGPLLIVPKLMRYLTTGEASRRKLVETLLRLNTLISAVGAFSMLLMIAFRFPDASLLPVVWLVLSAVPYYIVYCRDLIACGYEWWDLPRMYGLNLLLIPVNLVGILKSLQQRVTGRQWAFVRTPKVPGRTAAPPLYILLPIVIQIAILFSTTHAFVDAGWAYGAYGIANAVCLGYAIFCYVGLEAGVDDIARAITTARFTGSPDGFATSASQPQRIAANEL